MNAERLVCGPVLGPQQSNLASGDKWTSEMVRFSCPCCSSHLVFGSTQLHLQLLSLPGMVAGGSLNWVIWRSLSQLDENVGGDTLPLKAAKVARTGKVAEIK